MKGLGLSADDHAALAIVPGVMFAGIAGGIAFPILPVVGLHAGLSLPFIGLILAANRIARIFSSPGLGLLSDRLGGRRLLVAGLGTQVVVMLFYLVGVVTTHPGSFFLAARLLHGPASAAVFVSAQVLALHAGGRRHGGRAAGLVRAALTAGMPVGLVVGGLLSARFGNRVTFTAAALAVAAAAGLAATLVPDLRAAGKPRVELRSTLRVMTDRRILALGALNFAAFFSAGGTLLTTLVLLVDARHLTLRGLGIQPTASLAMGVLVTISAVGTLSGGRLGDRYRAHAQTAIVGMVLLVAGLLVTMVARSSALLFAAVGLVGLGSGVMSPSTIALVGRFVAAEARGTAVGAIQLLSDVGGALGPIVAASLFASSTGMPFLVSAAVVACALPIGFWLIRPERAADTLTAPTAGEDLPSPSGE